MAYVRTVKTASGAIAVQIVYSSRRGSPSIEHLGSAHDDGELEALKAAARQRLVAGQNELDLGLAGLCQGLVASRACRCLRRACRAGASVAGALRRVHPILRR